jgi:hypothetical protein
MSDLKAAELVGRAVDGAKPRTKRSSEYAGSPQSNDEYERAEKDRRQKRPATRAIHLHKPRMYNSKAVYDKYESWMEIFRYWRDLHDLQEYGTMLPMSMVLTGAAKKWYDLNVRRHETGWTLDKMSEEIFHDIFPVDYDSILCEAFKDVCEGTNPLKKWHKYLIKLSKHVRFVNELELHRKF